MTQQNNPDDSDSSDKDPSQMTVPAVETETSILGPITTSNYILVIPAMVMSLFTVLSMLAGARIISLFFGAMTLLLSVAAAIIITSTAWHSTPVQRARDWFAYLTLTKTMPWSYHDSLANAVHNIEEVYADGTVETSDGRFVTIVRSDGINTNGLDASEIGEDELVSVLSRGVDEEAHDSPFHYYSTTADFDTGSIVGHYLDAADDNRLFSDSMRYVREMYLSLYEWYVDVDEPSWQANYWQHYVITEVSPSEVSTQRDDEDGVREILWPPDVRDISVQDRRAMKRELKRREVTVEDVISSVPGGEAHSVGAAETIALLKRYWGDEQSSPVTARPDSDADPADTDSAPVMCREPDQAADPEHVRKLAAADGGDGSEDNDTDTDEETVRPTRVLLERLPYIGPDRETSTEDIDRQGAPSRDAVTPDHFGTNRHHGEVGDQYVKTFWIAKWPQDAQSMFLRKLTTMRGAEIDLKIYNQPLDKRTVIDALKYDVRDLILEEDETGDQLSSMELGDDQETYAHLYQLLRSTSTHPWEINGYLTIRVTTETALDQASSELDDVPLSVLKRRVLDDISKDVKKVAEGSPADLTLVEPRERRKECFVAGSPIGPDEYASSAEGDSVGKRVAGSLVSEGASGALRSSRSTLGAGGAVGAMMPWCSAVVTDDNAPLWGRNQQNGSPLTIDPFDRGSAPHLLTVGKSRHGKTYSVSEVAGRWYNESDDRTLIVCDTQSGFAGLTEYCDGEHIVVDGSRNINPLHIEKPEHMHRFEDESSVLQQKVEEVAEFFRSALVAQGAPNPSDYTSDLEEIAVKAYEDAGFIMGDPDSLANPSPGISEFLQAGSDLLHEAEERSISGHEAEVSRKEQRLGELLNYLSGFREGEKYHDLLGGSSGGTAADTSASVEPIEQRAREAVISADGGQESGMGIGLDDPDVDMVYLDLRQFRRHDDVDKSVMLQLLLGQITQAIRNAGGESMFIVDEAHVLYHSQEMVRWLEKSAREWARYDAALWMVTQHPSEVLGYDGIDGAEVVKDQCSTIQVFKLPGVDDETLAGLGIPPSLGQTVRSGLTAGKEGKGYSECLLNLHDQMGWISTRVEASPFEHSLLTYSPREDGDLDDYVEREWGEI